MDKQDEPEKTIPQQDIDAYKRMFPDDIPERENNRPRESSDWIDFTRWPF
jgi:hypothetical protein